MSGGQCQNEIKNQMARAAEVEVVEQLAKQTKMSRPEAAKLIRACTKGGGDCKDAATDMATAYIKKKAEAYVAQNMGIRRADLAAIQASKKAFQQLILSFLK